MPNGEKDAVRVALGLIALGAVSRLMPHPPNVTPLAAMALLGGAYLPRRLALAFPVAALALSDLALGLHATLPFVYAAFLLSALLGQALADRRTAGRVAAASLASSVLFFLVSNIGVWAVGSLYPPTGAGLASCFTAALPFFRHTVLGDLAFTAVLFGAERAALALLARRRVMAAA